MCENLQEFRCRVCSTVTGVLPCPKCKSVFYCSRDHQIADWPQHRQECRWIAAQMRQTQLDYQNLGKTLWPEQCNPQSVNTTDANMIDHIIQAKRQKLSDYNLDKAPHNETPKQRTSDTPLTRYTQQSERRYEDLCRIIIRDMNTYGLSVVDDFLGRDRGLQIFNEVHKMYAAGVFRDGQLVKNSLSDKDLRTIRGDKITWVKGTENGCTNIGYLINQIDAVVSLANTMRDNGQLGNYKIRERTKAMVACYPGSGAHYVMHVDNPNRDGRVITAIYYLNLDWDTQRSGGILRIFPENGGSVADIEPKFDRIIFFWSDRRNPHEVQPSNRTRYAITVWYFDANEREAALNRCRQYNNQTANCT